MTAVCFYFQVHQPLRMKRYRIFDIGSDHVYYNDRSETSLNNKKILKKVADKCYLPTNKILLALLKKHPEFRISFSFSGIFLEQAARYYPEVIESFQKLIKTKQVEVLAETYYHSLSSLYSRTEFENQVRMHEKMIKKLFGVKPRVFRNTELIYSNDIARYAAKLGYKGVLAEGADKILSGKSPNHLYNPKGIPRLRLLLKNYRLSDDIAFRFSNTSWDEYPLTAKKFASWLSATEGDVINLFMDYETFGEHQWESTGIFTFLKKLPAELLKNNMTFVTPSEAIAQYRPQGSLNVPEFVSWADTERDLSAWISNGIQQDAIKRVYALEASVLATLDQELIHDWRLLQTSDHYYYMCTKWFEDGDVHKYFNPYSSPYDAFIACMNIVNDLEWRIKELTS